MEKVIHYCWFGGKKLPKLAKKCLKSWKEYLPDFEIKAWNEENSDLEACEFIKQAFKNKKWAFVSDYVRLKALYDYGGIYFDTDMEVIKNIDKLLEKDFFIGKEDSGYIAAGVIWVKEKHNKYIKEILDLYNNMEGLDINDLFSISIPRTITSVLKKYKSVTDENGIEIIDNSVYVYPSDYFYPINYDYSKKEYTKNTCMVHYYNATWVPKKEQFTIGMYRRFGVEKGKKIIRVLSIPKRIYWKIRNPLSNIFGKIKYKVKRGYDIYFRINKRIKNLENELSKLKKYDYVAFHNKYWLGVTNSTRDLFDSTASIEDVFTEREARKTAEVILKGHKKMLIFSGFAKGYSRIIEIIKEHDKDVIIKVLWHGSNALLVEQNDWEAFNLVLFLYKNGNIDEIGFVKKSLYEFFKQKGYRVSFVMNYVDIDKKKIKIKDKYKRKDGEFRIGLYSSLDRWVKNTYNQISAISLFENVKADITPLSMKSFLFAANLGLDTSLSVEHNIPREELLGKMSQNDINVYVTFTECSPMIPLESLELGVPCITGDNHHYFENTELEKYLVVTKEDNIMAIYEKIKYALENKDKIIELYKKWKEPYKKNAKKSVEEFLKINK